MFSPYSDSAWGGSSSALVWLVAVSVAAVAAVTDWRTGRIPNLLTFPALAGGLTWSAWNGGASGFLVAMGSALLLALPCFLLFLFAGGGAGDVKLLGALGSWLGFHDAVVALVCVSVSGVVCGLLYTLARRRSTALLANMSRIAAGAGVALATRRVRDAKVLMPEEQEMQPFAYGVAICLGVWAAAAGRWLWNW